MEAKNYEDNTCCCEVKKDEPSLCVRLSYLASKLNQTSTTLMNIQRTFDGEERVCDKMPDPKSINDDLYYLAIMAETILLQSVDIQGKISG